MQKALEILCLGILDANKISSRIKQERWAAVVTRLGALDSVIHDFDMYWDENREEFSEEFAKQWGFVGTRFEENICDLARGEAGDWPLLAFPFGHWYRSVDTDLLPLLGEENEKLLRQMVAAGNEGNKNNP